MFKKLKENKKKGFTLVELIVVLVILAILAALLIPALTGYIKKAKEKQITAETRQLVMAAQTLTDEQYAKLNTGVELTAAVTIGDNTGINGSALTLGKGDIKELAEISVTAETFRNVQVDKSGKITTATYVKGTQQCVYKAEPAATEEKYNVGTTSGTNN